MSSRDGPRASGTDGSDFTHRERVATHYKESVRWKVKMKYAIVPHLFVGFLVTAWMIAAYAGFTKLKPQLWEVIWLLSIVPAILGLMSLPRNNSRMLYSYLFGLLLTGIAPLAFGASQLVAVVLQNSRNNAPADSTAPWQVLPMKLAAVAILIQMHVVGILYSKKLINSWETKGTKKTS